MAKTIEELAARAAANKAACSVPPTFGTRSTSTTWRSSLALVLAKIWMKRRPR